MQNLSPSASNEETSAERPADPAYRAAQSLAYKALLLADTYQTPPVPRAYEVWYSYAKGIPEAVAQKINTLIARKGALDVYDLDQIHLAHLSHSETERKRQELIGDYLDREMEDIIRLVQSHLESSENYSGSLEKSAAQLAPTSSPAQIKNVVEALLAENRKMRSDSTKLRESLQQTKSQVRQLRTNLAKSREKELRDPMTNLANRRLFEMHLTKEIAEARRSGAPLCLAIADIDHFKRFNDTFGHLVGDDVLRYFAGIFAGAVSGRDLAARFGGEEFALILTGRDPKAAAEVVQGIMTALSTSRLVVSKGKTPIGDLTASFGIALLGPEDDLDGLVQRADDRLYEAKRAGRNRIASD